MRQLEKRQIILIGVLAALIVVFVVWKFVLSTEDGTNSSVDPVTTQTTVATGQVTEDPTNPATADRSDCDGSGGAGPGPGPDRGAFQHLRLSQPLRARRAEAFPLSADRSRSRGTGQDLTYPCGLCSAS